jgi:hypothetical protein
MKIHCHNEVSLRSLKEYKVRNYMLLPDIRVSNSLDTSAVEQVLWQKHALFDLYVEFAGQHGLERLS